MHEDDRGVFTEVFREEWDIGVRPIQWNVVRNKAGILRGVHVHLTHWDYLLIVDGVARIGLHDPRENSPTRGMSRMLDVSGEEIVGLIIPPGVFHGFFFKTNSMHVYSVSHYWDPIDDEFGCRFDDPNLGMDWGETPPRVSERDASLPSFPALMQEIGHRIHALEITKHQS